MKIKPDEITQILKDKISGFEKTAELEETGRIVQEGSARDLLESDSVRKAYMGL